DLGFADALAKVEASIHVGLQRSETALKSTWHLPASHFLEAWGDLVTADGTLAIQQPLIAPLRPTRSEIEVLAAALGIAPADGLALVRETCVGQGSNWNGEARLSEAQW